MDARVAGETGASVLGALEDRSEFRFRGFVLGQGNRRDPGGSIGTASDDNAGNEKFSIKFSIERERADSDSTGSRQFDRITDLDCCQCRADGCARGALVASWNGDSGSDADTNQADSVTREECIGVIAQRHQVGCSSEGAGAGKEPRWQVHFVSLRRVAVMSCEIPTERSWRST